MTDITLVPITGAHNLSAINNNFSKVQEAINNDVLNLDGGNNVMQQDLDMNSNQILNIGVDVNNPGSVLTVSAGDSRYYNVSGDTLAGPMNVNGHALSGLAVAIASTSPLRKQEFDNFVSTLTSTAGAFQQEGTGAVVRTYQDKMRDSVSVNDFGAIGDGTYHPLSERFASLGLAQAAYPFVTSLTQSIDYAAIQAALTAVEVMGGKGVFLPGGRYVLTDGVQIADSIELWCDTPPGAWDTVFANRAKTWEGATLLAYGTGPRNWSRRGVTSMKLAGGLRSGLSLSTLMNLDASGSTPATPRLHSWLVRPKNRTSRGWALTNVRLCPWIGADGISEYSNQAFSGLANDWDGGVLLEDCEYVKLTNVQSVGYWRRYGCLLVNSDFDVFGGQERNVISGCKFQGLVGLSVRAGDTRAVAAKSNSTVEIAWDDESFWTPSGTFTGFPASVFQQYSYTSLSRNGANLVFNGVTPDPTIQNLTQLRAPCRSTGAAGTVFENTFTAGLDHTSGVVSTGLGLGNSTALEMSGYPLRGISFINTKAQTREATRVFFHDCQDTLWCQSQTEGSGAVIASPATGSSSAPNPSGDTRNLRLLSTIGFSHALFTPRSIFDDMSMFNATGLNAGLDIRPLDTNPVTFSNVAGTETARFTDTNRFGVGTTAPAQKFQVSTTNSEVARIERTGSTGLVGVQYKNDAGTFSVRSQPTAADAGTFFASGNGTISLGTTSFPWSGVFSVNGTYTGPVQIGKFTLATLPSASTFNGFMIDVTNATGGPKTCRSNGTVWQILNTTTTVS